MLIKQARECYESLSEFRRKRNRCLDYTYGRQWNDIIEVDGRRMTEYEYIIREGNVPLKNNLIRRIVRNVIGVFRSKLPEMMKIYDNPELKKISESNRLEELYSRSMEEFLISGMVVHRKNLTNNSGKPEVKTRIVSPGSFFFNTDSNDLRGEDLFLVGQIHKVNFQDWCAAFVSDRDSFQKARKIFENSGKTVNVTEVWRREMTDGYLVHDRKKGCIRHISGKESKDGYASSRWEMKEKWRYYFLTDDGAVLKEGDSPYRHGRHPYVFKCYPFLDGEIQSFVNDMIDQQRYTNRLITLYDWVIRASAKGVLLLPEGAVEPENLQSVADQWGRFNGVILYKADPANPEPKQISGNLSNLGISELLEIQLKMLEDVSGVNGILQGNTSGGNVSGELYNSQTANAMFSLSDILETFGVFIKDCCEKDLWTKY